MDLNRVLLVAAALLPAIVLCRYVYKKDKVEKEPIGLLIKLLLAGVISCFPAAAVEGIAEEAIDGAFSAVYGGMVTESGTYLYLAVTYFIGVALVEEGFKWGVLVKLTKNNREFNCIFDGMVYAIFVSLGFAAFENVLYVLDYGWATAITRGLLSVPGHMFDAVMMGYYYSRWQIFEKAAIAEKNLIRLGFAEKGGKAPFDYKKEKWLSLIVPVIFHGIYDFCCVVNAWWATVVFYGFVLFMYIYCFAKIKETAAKDLPMMERVSALLANKYPEVSDVIIENQLTEA